MFIDFKEISDYIEWELFAKAFFISNGKTIEEAPSVGSDGGTGKDLIISELLESDLGPPIKRQYLVSCKHFAHRKGIASVTEKDEKEQIGVNMKLEESDGFIGFYSTYPSSTLIENLNRHKLNETQIIKIYDRDDIERYLLYEDKDFQLLKRFFKKSFEKWLSLGRENIDRNTNFEKLTKEYFQEKNKDYYKKYFEGQPADWSIIQKYTFKRSSFDPIIKNIEANQVCLITGAGGEGKTTLLMQVGTHYFKKGYEVFFSFDSFQHLDPSKLHFNPKINYLLIIDRANTIDTLEEFIKKVKFSSNIKVLLASRKNEWLQALSARKNTQNLLAWIGEEITIGKLSATEVKALTSLLSKYKINDHVSESQINEVLNNGAGFTFLLSIMLYATKGKSFSAIIDDVIRNIRNSNEDDLALRAIGYIVCIEVLGRGPHGQMYCQESMLRQLLNIRSIGEYISIRQQLSEEAFFQGTVDNLIFTRNINIGKLYFDSLFHSDQPVLNLYNCYYDILREAVSSKYTNNFDLIATIPKFAREINAQLAEALLKDAISFGFFFNSYFSFIDEEIQKKNFGHYDGNEYSVRWLFDQAFHKNSQNPNLYTFWANFELKQNEAVSNIRKGLVKTELNYQEYSVKWILKKGTLFGPSEQVFEALAKIEEEEGNRILAKEICKEGIEKLKSSRLIGILAEFEIHDGEIETAKEILSEGIIASSAPHLYLLLSDLELTCGNADNAREILNQGLKKGLNDDLLYALAKIDFDEGFPDKARMTLLTGLDQLNSPILLVSLAKLEASIGNVEEARNLFKKRVLEFEEISVIMAWIKLEIAANNLGEIDIAGSARGIFYKAWEKHKKNRLFAINFLFIETRSGRIGSIDKQFSAEWLFAHCLKLRNTDYLSIGKKTINNLTDLRKFLFIDKDNHDFLSFEEFSDYTE